MNFGSGYVLSRARGIEVAIPIHGWWLESSTYLYSRSLFFCMLRRIDRDVTVPSLSCSLARWYHIGEEERRSSLRGSGPITPDENAILTERQIENFGDQSHLTSWESQQYRVSKRNAARKREGN